MVGKFVQDHKESDGKQGRDPSSKLSIETDNSFLNETVVTDRQ